MTIAITGASGQLGQLALAAIAARGGAAIGLARDPSKVKGPARAFDYTKPETFGALEGVEILVLISSNDFNDRAGQHKAVIEAAKAAWREGDWDHGRFRLPPGDDSEFIPAPDK